MRNNLNLWSREVDEGGKDHLRMVTVEVTECGQFSNLLKKANALKGRCGDAGAHGFSSACVGQPS